MFLGGIYQGVVTNNNDPEKRGRLKVKCPSVFGDNIEISWCDPFVPVAYDNGGDFYIPSKDEMVWLFFIEGDINRPVWSGGWWSENKTPLSNNYTDIDKLRIINYGNCTILMRDGVIDINVGEGLCDLKIEHNKVTVQGDLVVTGRLITQDD